MYRKIGIIGLGSLGSHIAYDMAERKETNEIILIDYDKVEDRNIGNSFYNRSHVGQLKVEAMSDIIVGSVTKNLTITKIPKSFLRIFHMLPKCDLLIDCRDVIDDKKKNVDVKLYISGRKLILDFRKKSKFSFSYEGKYNSLITKTDLRRASICFTDFLNSKYFGNYIESNRTHAISLDTLSRVLRENAVKTMEVEKRNSEVEIMYDVIKGEERIHNLDKNIYPILQGNKKDDTKIYLGDSEEYIGMHIVPKKAFRTPDDVVEVLVKMISYPGIIYPGYIINIVDDEDGMSVELLPETGAA